MILYLTVIGVVTAAIIGLCASIKLGFVAADWVADRTAEWLGMTAYLVVAFGSMITLCFIAAWAANI